MVHPLVGTGITANQLTTARLITGLGGAACFAFGSPSMVPWGGLLFLLSTFLDRADGELARLSRTCTKWGDTYDVYCDIAVNTLIFVGIGFGLRTGNLGGWAVLAGMAACLGVSIIYWLITRIEETLGNDVPVVPINKDWDADDVLFLVAPVAWLGWLEPFVVIAAFGAPLFALGLWWHYRHNIGAATQ